MRDARFPDISIDPPSPRQARLDRIRTEVAEQFVQGTPVSVNHLLAAHSDLLPELEEELRVLEMTHQQLWAVRRVESYDPAHPTGTDVVVPGYIVEGPVGKGGQGEVFRARQRTTGRVVAIKVLDGGPLLSRRRQTRLEREVAILASLHHPNIVGVFDYGRTADGSLFMAMDYIEGADLDAWVAARRSVSGSYVQFVEAVLKMFISIAGAIAEAHERKIVHRDLKPSNVRVNSRNEPYLLDFGLARVVNDEAPAVPAIQVTMDGNVLGSLPWLSPEQATGTNSDVDAPSDIYSIGVMLYEALVQQPPYALGPTLAQSLLAIQHSIPEPPSHRSPELSPAIDVIVLKSLAKSPVDRYANGAELLAALRTCLDAVKQEVAAAAAPVPPTAMPLAAARAAAPPSYRRWVAVILATAAVLALVLALPKLVLQEKPPEVADTQPTRQFEMPFFQWPADVPNNARLITTFAVDDSYVKDGSDSKTPLGLEGVNPQRTFERLEVKSLEAEGSKRDTYLRFSLVGVPTEKRIHRASLWLHGTAKRGRAPEVAAHRSMTILAFAISTDKVKGWDERTLAWGRRPFLIGWNDANLALASTAIPFGEPDWHQFDLTDFTRKTMENRSRNLALGLHAIRIADIHAVFSSAETDNPPTLRIYLEP